MEVKVVGVMVVGEKLEEIRSGGEGDGEGVGARRVLWLARRRALTTADGHRGPKVQ